MAGHEISWITMSNTTSHACEILLLKLKRLPAVSKINCPSQDKYRAKPTDTRKITTRSYIRPTYTTVVVIVKSTVVTAQVGCFCCKSLITIIVHETYSMRVLLECSEFPASLQTASFRFGQTIHEIDVRSTKMVLEHDSGERVS